jgi:hypothetical protein
MPRTVRAKFMVEAKTQRCSGKGSDGKPILMTDIELRPVMADTPENKAFWQWTPSGKIVLGCTNPEAADTFAIGSEYFIDFTPVGLGA